MTTETILTDEIISELAAKHLWAHAQFDGAGEVLYEGETEFARAIEQAVLQSEQVKSWKRDSELFKFLLEEARFQRAFDRFDPADGGKQDKFESECRRILGAAQGQGGSDDA